MQWIRLHVMHVAMLDVSKTFSKQLKAKNHFGNTFYALGLELLPGEGLT